MDGTTSSSLNEARLGYEKFGKETHAYSVAYSDDEIPKIKKYADKIIFNSVSQLDRYYKDLKGKNLGIRINPSNRFGSRISHSDFELADPAKAPSRLGVLAKDFKKILPKIKGCMFHFNCENDDVADLSNMLKSITLEYLPILKKLEWVSLGGGISFTKEGYPVEDLCLILNKFRDICNVQIYLEPGDAVTYNSTELVTSVLDIVKDTDYTKDIAIVNASAEAHMLDLLTYRERRILNPQGLKPWNESHIIAGRSCLAGDFFGQGFFPDLKIGDTIKIPDAGGYTMVKKNWFNGLPMPSIAVKELDGSTKLIKSFNYNDFVNSLS
jgi:carboxynorspermidine decarboxylase